MHRPALARTAALLLLPLAPLACTSISDSVGSVSGSVSKALDSLSGSLTSSSGEVRPAADYRRDVLAYASEVVRESAHDGEGDEVVRGLTRVAELHGISGWERSDETARALRDGVADGTIDARGAARLREDLRPLQAPALLAALAPARAGGR